MASNATLSFFCNAYTARARPVHLNLKVCIYLNLTTYTTETSDLNYRTRSNNRPQFSLNLSPDADDIARPDQLGYMFQQALSLEQHMSLRTFIWFSHSFVASNIMVDASVCLPNLKRTCLAVAN